MKLTVLVYTTFADNKVINVVLLSSVVVASTVVVIAVFIIIVIFSVYLICIRRIKTEETFDMTENRLYMQVKPIHMKKNVSYKEGVIYVNT